MIIYRPHCGTLAEAMTKAKEFDSVDAMKAHIVQTHEEINGVRMFEEDDIIVKDESVSDFRNGWKDTRYVCIKRYGNEKYLFPQCIGMCATDYPKKED